MHISLLLKTKTTDQDVYQFHAVFPIIKKYPFSKAKTLFFFNSKGKAKITFIFIFFSPETV